MIVFDLLSKYQEAFLNGLAITLKLSFIAWTNGIIIGVLIGFLGSRYSLTIGKISKVFAFILSGIPVLVLLFWLHYPLQAILNVVIDPFYTSAATLSIINIFSVSEIVRSALNDFPYQYIVSAKVCGLTPKQTFRFIQLPIIFRQVIPTILFLQVTILQMTLFASLISVNEIFRVTQQINAIEYKPVEIYSTLAIFFLLICLPLNGLAIWLKNKYTRNISEK